MDCGAKVTVINTQISDVLGGLASRGVIDWKARAYNIGDLEGFFLVVAENDDLNLCKNVAMEAEERGVLLNVVDVTHLVNFIAPAIVLGARLVLPSRQAGIAQSWLAGFGKNWTRAPSCGGQK